MWQSIGCRSHLAATAPLTQRCSVAQWSLQRRQQPLRTCENGNNHCAVAAFGRGQDAKQCCCWEQPPRSASPPSRAAAKATSLLRTSSLPLPLSRGTGWLWERCRARTMLPRPLHATAAAFQLVQKIANLRPQCSPFSCWKISWRLHFPVYCSCHQDVTRLKTAV